MFDVRGQLFSLFLNFLNIFVKDPYLILKLLFGIALLFQFVLESSNTLAGRLILFKDADRLLFLALQLFILGLDLQIEVFVALVQLCKVVFQLFIRLYCLLDILVVSLKLYLELANLFFAGCDFWQQLFSLLLLILREFGSLVRLT